MLHGVYDPILVLVSVVIAVTASYVAFSLGERVTASEGRRRIGWVLGGASAMGLGIWSMHYIGMLAFSLPVAVVYHVPTVALSLLAAVMASAVALHVVGKHQVAIRQTIAGGVFMGAAISSMHYIGMAAMRSTAMHHYDRRLVACSVAIAGVCSFAALWLVFRFRIDRQQFHWGKFAGALFMGSGIAAMHYTGMAAAQFHGGEMLLDLSHTVAVSSLSVAAISGTTLLVLATTLLTSWIDRRLATDRLVRHVLESLNVVLWQATPAGAGDLQRTFIRSGAETIFGLKLHELDGGAWEARIHAADRPAVLKQYHAAAAGDKPIAIEYRFCCAGDKSVWIREIVRAIRIGAGVRLLGTALDITELRRTQEALLAKEKIAALGRLSATIAHEINNPLEAVGNLLYLANTNPNLPPEVREHLDVAEQELRRAAEISQHTLGFARLSADPADVELGHLIDELLLLYRSKMRNKDLRVETAFRVKSPVRGCPGELRQVFSNLLSNAIDAAPSHSSIRVRISRWVDYRDGHRPGVLVSVADTGEGISPELRSQVFEPFFTTKKDVGTGLGLWVVRQLAEKQQGWAKLKSQVGRGTVVAVFVPTCEKANGASA
jgi:two-component system sensor histidine kinase/response regulator